MYEYVNYGGLFGGIGTLVVTIVFAVLLIKFGRWMDMGIRREERYNIFEEAIIDKIALKKGIDIPKEILKRDAYNNHGKDIRKRFKEEIYDEMFGKKDKDKKPKEVK